MSASCVFLYFFYIAAYCFISFLMFLIFHPHLGLQAFKGSIAVAQVREDHGRDGGSNRGEGGG